MTRTPRLTGPEMIRALKALGFVEVRVKGSHHRLAHSTDQTRRVTVAVHGNNIIPLGTFMNILKEARLTADDLRRR